MKDQKIIPTFWIENSPYNWENLGSGQSFRYEKGQTLFLEGTQMNHIYLIKQGKVKLSITNCNGDEKTVGFLGKNSIVGTSSLFNNAQYMFNATTVSNSFLLKYGKKEFIQRIMSDEELMTQVFRIMSLRIQILTNHALDLSFNHSYKRLARALLDISKTYGKKLDNGSIFIDFKITQQELGEIIGTTWVTVSNNLKKLTVEGIIERKGQNYIINDYIGLKKIGT